MKNQEISTLIGQKRAYNSSSFLLYTSKKVRNLDNNPKNIAILAPKKTFKTAVVRNKARRWIRSAIQKIAQNIEFKDKIREYNLIFSLKKQFIGVSFVDIVEEIKQSLVKNGII